MVIATPDARHHLESAVLTRYLPADLAEQMLAQPHLLSAEQLQPHATYLADLLYGIATYIPRKIVVEQLADPAPGRVRGRVLPGTTLFSDVSGFTAMSEKLTVLGKAGAEEITRILNDLFTTLLSIIDSYEGCLFKFGGDALTVFFDGPDHPWRAVAAAMDMQAAMHRFAALETLYGTFTLRMRVGVHTGPIFVAEVGLPERIEAIVTGENINLTALAEEAAEPTTVAISAATLAVVKPLVETQPLEEPFHQVVQLHARPPAAARAGADLRWPVAPTPADLAGAILRIEALRPYLVAGLFDKIAVAPQQVEVEGELRLVTVLFANFYDFSEILKHLGDGRADEATAILNRYFTSMQKILNQYGGTINKVDMYTHGDKLMVLFGAPLAYENDPERAVRAASEMQAAMQDLTTIKTSAGTFSLRQKIGINTGTVFAGNAGSPTRKEYTVMGDEVNLTARLMSAAQENQILISHANWRKVRDLFELQPLAPVRVKGKANPIPIYAVQGAKEVLRRERAAGAMGHTRLVGREQEVATMHAATDRALAGQGQLLAVCGEAGTGKSRLIKELEDYLQASPATPRLLYGECQSYGQSMAYLPFVGLLKQFFGLTNADSAEQAVTKVTQAVDELAPEYHAFIPLLGMLLSLPIPDSDVTRALGSELRRARTMDLVRTLLVQAAQAQPLVLILEDLHWVDTASLDLLNYLARGIAASPLLMLLVYRPEFTHELATLPYYTAIMLHELSEEQSLALVQSMLNIAELPASLRDLILQKSQGNPLFVEEVVKSLVEHGVIAHVDDEWQVQGDMAQVEIPDTIQGVIMARIDRLQERSRHVLQVASVVGRRFPLRVLEAVYPFRVDLQDCLSGLLGLDLVMEEGPTGEPVFVFKHIMTQEVAYESMLFGRRREYHRKVGSSIEDIYADRLVENYELLAYHYEKGEHWAKALGYDVLAGGKARRQYANKEALQYFGRVLEVLDTPQKYRLRLGAEEGDPVLTIPHTEEVTWRRDSLLGRGDVLALLGEFDRALADYEAAIGFIGEQRGRADAFWRMAEVQQFRGQYPQALERLERAVEELGADTDSPEAARVRALQALVLVRQGKFDDAERAAQECLAMLAGTESYAELRASYNVLGLVNFRRGRFEQTIDYWQRGLAFMEKMGDVREAARLYSNLAAAYGQKGDLDASIPLLDKALQTFEKIGEVKGIAMTYINLGGTYRRLGDYTTAIEYYTKSLPLNERIGDARFAASTNNNLCEAYREIGDYEKAIEHGERALAVLQEIGAAEALPECYHQLAQSYVLAGDLDRALELATLALEHATRMGSRVEETQACAVLGQVHALQSNWQQAEEHFAQAVAVLEQINQPRELAEVRYYYGLALRDYGETARARDLLAAAAAFYREAGDTHHLRRVEEELAGLVRA